MSHFPKYFEPDPFSRSDVQDMLDEAQLDAGSRFADIPHLQDQLQEHFRRAIEECNRREVDQMEILREGLLTERAIMDAYIVEYKAAENIREALVWFPLRAAVLKRGLLIQAPPIYQVEEPAEAHQQYAPRPNVASKAPPQVNDTRKKTSNNSAVKAKKTGGFGSPNYNKLRDAPSPWLSFPSGNLTMAEIAAFIPQAIKSVDVIDRFLYNGALSGTLAEMINYFRTMPLGPIEKNSVYRMMKAPMDVRAKTERIYQGWTVTKHATIPKPAGFDPTSVSVANFRVPQHYIHSREAAIAAQQPQTVLFRDMAKGVKITPSGYDALDLTRCIKYCVENKGEDWYYPQDFARLVNHLGGAVAVHREHQDAAAITRHTSGMDKNIAGRSMHQRDSHGLRKQPDALVDSSDEEETFGSESDESMDSDEDDNDIIAVCTKNTKHDSTGSFDNMDVDEEDENDTIAVCIRDTDRRTVSFDDMDTDDDEDSDEDTIAVNVQRIKRNRSVSFDEADEGSRSSSKLLKRHKKDAPSHGRQATLPDDIDSESDSDVYVGPKNSKNAGVVARTSSRHRQFSGSYNVDEAFDTEVEDA